MQLQIQSKPTITHLLNDIINNLIKLFCELIIELQKFIQYMFDKHYVESVVFCASIIMVLTIRHIINNFIKNMSGSSFVVKFNIDEESEDNIYKLFTKVDNFSINEMKKFTKKYNLDQNSDDSMSGSSDKIKSTDRSETSEFDADLEFESSSDSDVSHDNVNVRKDDRFILIGLTGYARSGKDTVADYLVDEYDFKKLSFATSLKEACKCVFGFTNKQLYGDDKDVIDEYWGYKPREILQKVGTELFRKCLADNFDEIGDEIWIRSLEKQIKKYQAKGYNRFVIADVRFENEESFIHNFGGSIWKVQKHKHNTRQVNPHSSESFIDTINHDELITNNSSFEKLYDQIESLCEDFE